MNVLSVLAILLLNALAILLTITLFIKGKGGHYGMADVCVVVMGVGSITHQEQFNNIYSSHMFLWSIP